ncbi:MAG: ketoacyl-ACP synthase III [Pseudomonadota bacterium]
MKATNNYNVYSVITGTGSYIPERRVLNEDFLQNEFYGSDSIRLTKSNQAIIEKFASISGIKERRYVADDLTASDIACFAAQEALASAHIDRETLDYLIVAHNFGDIRSESRRSESVPSISARVKYKLGIKNPRTVCYDIQFGCPGWLQGVIQADCFIKTRNAKRVLVIGAETLSRISDPHDVDSMIYSDGAGATIFEAKESNEPVGILSHLSRTDTLNHAFLLHMGKSYNPDCSSGDLFLKMDGHKVYEYALGTVPLVVKECLEKAQLSINDISKVLLHQANVKMDEAILKRVYKLYTIQDYSLDIMPMIIEKLGNSSVATLPTLADLLYKGKLDGHSISGGSILVFASVGAGMNINALTYKVPG